MEFVEAEPSLITMEYTPTLESVNDLSIKLQGDGSRPSSLLDFRQILLSSALGQSTISHCRDCLL